MVSKLEKRAFFDWQKSSDQHLFSIALLIGLSRSLSIKFAFLLSIPVIALATLLKTFDLVNEVNQVDWSLLLIGFVIALITSYTTIVFFM